MSLRLSVPGLARLALSVSVALSDSLPSPVQPSCALCRSCVVRCRCRGCRWLGGGRSSLLVRGGHGQVLSVARCCRLLCCPCRGPGAAVAFLFVSPVTVCVVGEGKTVV